MAISILNFTVIFLLIGLVAFGAALGINTFLAGWMNRQREGNMMNTDIPATMEPVPAGTKRWAAILAASYTAWLEIGIFILAIAGEVMITSGKVLSIDAIILIPFVLWFIANCILFLRFVIFPHGKKAPPAAMYWALLSSWGGLWVFVGLSVAFFMIMVWTNVFGGLAALFCMILVALWVTITIVLVVGYSSRMARKNLVFAKVFNPGTALFIKVGTTVSKFVADFTGVPMARVPVPEDKMAKGPGAVWEWMKEDLVNRADPRPFASRGLWVGPSFFYPGIPYFVEIVGLHIPLVRSMVRSIGKIAVPLVQIPDQDFTKGPFAAGGTLLGTSEDDPELTPTVGFSWRVVNPLVLWNTADPRDVFDHAMDNAIAGLVEICGMDLYGFHGNMEYAASLYNDLAEAALLGSEGDHDEAAAAKAAGFAARRDRLLKLQRDTMNTIGGQTGILIGNLQVKDVDVQANVRAIYDSIVEAKARKKAAPYLASAKEQEIRAHFGTLLQLTEDYKIDDPEMRAGILKLAALAQAENGPAIIATGGKGGLLG